jgi:hypothetical protein
VGPDDLVIVGTRERKNPSKELVVEDAEAVQIRSGIDRPFGGHVGGRSQERSFAGGALRVATASDPEVGQLGDAVLGHQDVRRFDVAVDDARGMDGGKRFGNLGEEIPCFVGRKRATLCDVGPQGTPGDKLQDDEWDSFAGTISTHPNDMGGLDGARQVHFSGESLDVFRVLEVQVAEHLDGNELAALVVAGFPHHSHGASPDLFDQLEPLCHC